MSRIALSLLALTLLAGCGIKGSLARPDPMWGSERERVLEQRAAAERERQAREAAEQGAASGGTEPGGASEALPTPPPTSTPAPN